MTKKIYIVILSLLVSIASLARPTIMPEQYHFIAVWGSVGGSTLLRSSNANIRYSLGTAPGIGVGYRLYNDHLLFQLGVEAQYAYYNNPLKDTKLDIKMLDTENDEFLLKVSVHDSKDNLHAINALVPVYLGYEYRRFYFLAGAQLAYNIAAYSSSKALMNTTADYYGRYMEEFHDMPNHQLSTNSPLESESYKIQLNTTVYAHAEIGLRLGEFDPYKGPKYQRKPYRLYLSLYADYGVLNIHKNTGNPVSLTYSQTDQGLQFKLTPSFVSANMNDMNINPLSIGIKFTAAFELPEDARGVVYDNTESAPIRRIEHKSQLVIP